MKMRPTTSSQYLNVKPESDIDTNLLLNAKQVKDSEWWTVENCLVNQIVLGIDTPTQPLPELRFPTGLERYQILDVAKMITNRDVCNFNRMGYGKTVEAARAMRELGINTALIIAPKSVLLQWEEQIKRWYPERKNDVGIYSKEWLPKPGKIVIINYEKLIQETVLQRFKHFQWELVVADEAHRIKNRKSKRSIAVRSIPRARSWALTGTPITRLADDLWAILNFLGPYYSGKSYWNFVNYFCRLKEGFFGIEIDGLTDNPKRLDVLHKLLDKIAIINPDLGLTPGKVYETVKLKMDSSQKKLYRDAKNVILDELPRDMTIPNGAVLVTRLMQITSNPGRWAIKSAGAKFEYLKDLLSDNPNEKYVIFSKFESTCSDLAKYLTKNGNRVVQYTGKLDAEQRFESKNEFINNQSCQAIIGTIGAMGEGVDGLQNVARVVIFLEREWSPELVKQAEDRVNRFGQKQRVTVQFLECAGTYDQHVTTVNLKKSADIRRALESEEEV